MRWPKGPPHLALNPPYFLFIFFVFFAFLSLFHREKNLFSPKKGHFCCSLFCVSLCFFLAFLGPLFFSFSLFVSLVFFSFFLPLCFSFLYLVLALSFCFVCFFQAVLLFLFFCLLSCFVLNHNLRFVFALHLVSCCCCCWFLLRSYLFFIFLDTYQKHLWKKNMEMPKTAKMKNAEIKTDTLTRTVSTGVFTNSVFVFFFVFHSILHFCWEHYKDRGFSPPPPPKKKQKETNKNSKILKLKTGPSWSYKLVQVCCPT